MQCAGKMVRETRAARISSPLFSAADSGLILRKNASRTPMEGFPV
jgi:hypothetical protein